MTKTVDVCVLGATGLVGKQIIQTLEERDFPVGTLYPLASARSLGKTVEFKGEELDVLSVEDFDFSQCQIGLFSAGGNVSKEYAPIAAKAGCIVIDNTSEFRYKDDIPLVVPEVNGEKIADYKARNIIANPNCSTIQMLVALKPIQEKLGIERINVATYQSVSGAGKQAIDELAKQCTSLLTGTPVEPHVFDRQIAFNVIPQIDVFQDNGYTKEEMKMVWETQKIFADESIRVNPTAVRVPVFYGHAEAIHIEVKEDFDIEQVKTWLDEAQGVTILANDAEFPTQIGDAAGKDDVFVGRVRRDISYAKGLNLWVVADNVRKGAATNSIQIAEVLVEQYL
ncbi:aspartate-semialdehyde dehydrogenase [Catenovulum sp. SM1970]|uniref:aspartate-semialdehyde dehydrogenase n=1 Tax=Marinifaba aquimaris TaxID=2741323 RepID=UPI0015739678|nr:aspartate-semialdehyde dehydrogenase [Marinifaba aquimaris]NTS78256.1 aspartate-semialdehyde dehydrogenase [Marinifaba aquimaris]